MESLKYLAYGKLIHPPVIESDLPMIKTQWHLWGKDYPIEMPTVIGSAWKATESPVHVENPAEDGANRSRDGSIGLIFTNMSEESRRFRWKLEKCSLEGEELIDGRSVLKKEGKYDKSR